MSLIFLKRVIFLPKCSQFEGKGPSKHRGSQRFQEKGIFLAVLAQFNSFQLCESQCFLEKGSLSSPRMSAILKIRGHFSNEKVSEKGYLLILENDHTSYLLQMSGGTGTWTQHQPGIKLIKPLGQCWVLLQLAGTTEGLFTTRELHQEHPTPYPHGVEL